MMAEWWAMGGYGLYVWGSVGLTLALMAVEAMLLWRRSHRETAEVGDTGEPGVGGGA